MAAGGGKAKKVIDTATNDLPTHKCKALVKVLSEHTPLHGDGSSQVVSKDSSEPDSQEHQQETGETLVDVVRVVTLIVGLFP